MQAVPSTCIMQLLPPTAACCRVHAHVQAHERLEHLWDDT